MTERGICFTGASVSAILAGRKTQTRRLINMRDIQFLGAGGEGGADWNDPACWGYAADDGRTYLLDQSTKRTPWNDAIRCPFGVVGEGLWGKEAFAPRYFDDGSPAYRAAWTGHCVGLLSPPKWKSPRFMPRALSRLPLRVVLIRAQRLQDISEEDARAEGLALDPVIAEGHAVAIYARLWDEINGHRVPWERNPWVWAITFELLRNKRRRDDGLNRRIGAPTGDVWTMAHARQESTS